jgi:hypothetical protein
METKICRRDTKDKLYPHVLLSITFLLLEWLNLLITIHMLPKKIQKIKEPIFFFKKKKGKIKD